MAKAGITANRPLSTPLALPVPSPLLFSAVLGTSLCDLSDAQAFFSSFRSALLLVRPLGF
jgi:hypothetical protein